MRHGPQAPPLAHFDPPESTRPIDNGIVAQAMNAPTGEPEYRSHLPDYKDQTRYGPQAPSVPYALFDKQEPDARL